MVMSVHIERAHQLPITMNEKDPHQGTTLCNIKILRIKREVLQFSRDRIDSHPKFVSNFKVNDAIHITGGYGKVYY